MAESAPKADLQHSLEAGREALLRKLAPNADMWATADESREQIVGLYQRAWAHSDATINALALDAVGHVAWWQSYRNRLERVAHEAAQS